jgi:hypothetical protein
VHLSAGWAAYAVTTAARHFQSADALAVAALPPERGGGLLAATYDVHGVAAWRLPAAGAVQALGPAQVWGVRVYGVLVGMCVGGWIAASTFSCFLSVGAPVLPRLTCNPALAHPQPTMARAERPPPPPPPTHTHTHTHTLPQPPAVRLGGFQGLRDLYSLALSPDARWLAAGGEGGLLAFYSIDPTAPPRCAAAATQEYGAVRCCLCPASAPYATRASAASRLASRSSSATASPHPHPDRCAGLRVRAARWTSQTAPTTFTPLCWCQGWLKAWPQPRNDAPGSRARARARRRRDSSSSSSSSSRRAIWRAAGSLRGGACLPCRPISCSMFPPIYGASYGSGTRLSIS